MGDTEKINNIKTTLDLREWRKQINKKDVESIINKKDKWNYWWFSEDKKFVTTIENWKITNYKVDETNILFIEKAKKIPDIKEEKKDEVLMDLFLSPDCKVNNTLDAYNKAKWSDKTTFWFISKGKNRAVIVLDFSKWKKPIITSYPLDRYNLQMKAVKI